MFVDNKVGPPGCSPLRDGDRMPVLKAVSGDTWVVDAELCAADGGPASPGNSYVEFVLAENQFSPPIWTGTWMSGVLPDANRAGLVHVMIPRVVTKALRRGSYMFSMRVSDRMKYFFDTQLKGNFLVEYMPTSDQHSIPYRDGTSEIFGAQGGEGSEDSSETTPTPTPTPTPSKDKDSYAYDPKTGLYHRITVVTDSDGNITLDVAKKGVEL